RIRDEKRVRLNLEMPDIISMVLGDPLELESTLVSILTVLIDDAFEEGEVAANVSQTADEVTMRFSGKGTGLPQNQLDQQLGREGTQGGKELRRLAGQMTLLQEWGATLQSGSELGDGLEFVLRLRAIV
ncbi:MAG: ATP-binding protein, partial [Verrucomicrobiales bacterium]|nr:ATP-binding protein [Verrucomicrobiales bacterium]